MQVFIRKLTDRLYDKEKSFIHRWRSERLLAMMKRVHLPSKARIIDLGGSEWIWNLLDHDYHVTMVNLPGWNPPVSNPEQFVRIEADACDLKDVFPDRSFDLAFSNSTIEHVGDEERQAPFASEVRRLGVAYWVQTPSSRFPIEAHTGVPFYWKMPDWARARFHRSWEEKLPNWNSMMLNTRLLSRRRMQELFPDGQVYLEHRFAFEKSYSFYRPYDTAGRG